MAWNDQVASRKRGISGRFMSLSKRWTGFGSSKGAGAKANGTGNLSGSNFNLEMGFYPPDSPESIMRHLADYGAMLRDWRLAHSTYDFVRSDFSHDKAWAHHAAANEMAAMTSLIMPSLQSRARSDNLDQWLDAATYSYLTRCSSPSGVIRCLTTVSELCGNRGPNAPGHATRYQCRLLELGILGPIAQILTSERIADFHMTNTDSATTSQLTRQRQAGLWRTLAALSWARLGRSSGALSRLEQAKRLYGLVDRGASLLPFPSMYPLWDSLRAHAENDIEYDSGRILNGEITEQEAQGTSVLFEERLNTYVSRPTRSRLNSEDFSLHMPDQVEDTDASDFYISPLQSDGFE